MTARFNKGPALFLISSVFFSIMGVFVKLASPYASANEIAFFRFAFGITAVLVMVKMGRVSLRSERRDLLVVRGIFGGFAIILFFAAIKTGTLTNATVLHNMYPVFATVFAAAYLKERLKPAVLVPLAVAVTGVVTLTHPNFNIIRWGDLFAVVSAVLGGAAIVVIRELRKTESAWSVFFYLSVFGAAFSGLLAIPELSSPGWLGIVYILLVALFGTAGQLMATAAYGYCTASTGSVLSMSSVVFSAFFGMAFLGDRLTYTEASGAVMLLISSAYIAYNESGENKVAERRGFTCQ